VRGGVDEVGIITGELNRSFCWGVVPREREDTMGNVSWVHGGGPLARLAEGYGVELARLGFTRNSVVTHVVLMGQLSRWMSEVEIDVGELTEGRVEGFLDARRAGGQRRVPTARTLAPLFWLFEEPRRRPAAGG